MTFIKLWERLAEMFPKQDYQSRLERYIQASHPENVNDVERAHKRFDHQEFRGLSL